MLKGILLAFGCFCVFLVVHVVVFRIRMPERRFAAMGRLHFAFAPVLVTAYVTTPPDLWLIPAALLRAGWVIDLANGLLIHTFLFIGYSMFYFLVDRGFSARILIEIERAPGQTLTQEGVAAVYSLDEVVGRRLREMADIGRVVKNGDYFQVTRRGCLEGKLFAFLKSFFQLGPGG